MFLSIILLTLLSIFDVPVLGVPWPIWLIPVIIFFAAQYWYFVGDKEAAESKPFSPKNIEVERRFKHPFYWAAAAIVAIVVIAYLSSISG